MRRILEIKKNNKAQLGSLSNLLLGVLFIVVIVGVVYIVGSKFLGTFENNASNEYIQTAKAFSTTDTIVEFLPIVIIVSVAGLILYLVSKFGGNRATA